MEYLGGGGVEGSSEGAVDSGVEGSSDGAVGGGVEGPFEEAASGGGSAHVVKDYTNKAKTDMFLSLSER